ncbi:MAG TPA: hypothetical protein VF763_14130 [Candidatus Limnocylindrales bacterium]
MSPRDAATPSLPDESAPAVGPTLPALPLVGLTRRRAAFLLAAAVVLWIVAVFARQVADASAAVDRADRLRGQNASLAGEVATLQRERVLVQSQAFVAQQARAYGVGSIHEHAFALAPDAGPLPADAPGSATVRLGVHPGPTRTPLEGWLDLLFGPAPA